MDSLDKLMEMERVLVIKLASVRKRQQAAVLAHRSSLQVYEVSPAEARVLTMVREHRTNKEIGHALGISERTVKFHVSNLLNKFSVKQRSQL